MNLLYVCDTYCFVALLASFPRDWVKEQKISDVACIPYHTVQNGRVILDKLPSTFDTWFGVYISWIFINNN